MDPQNFTLETDEDQTKFYTTLDISVEAVDENEVPVLAVDRPAYLELTRSQVDQIRALPFAYQDSVPLLPGRYELSVIVRNRAAQQFTVLEQSLDTTAFAGDDGAGRSRLADVIPGFDGSELAGDAAAGAVRTFQVGSVRVQPAADGLFALGNTLYAFTHILEPAAGQQVRFQVFADESGEPDGEPLIEVPVAAPDSGAVLGRVPLDLGVGGNYWLRARLEDAGGALLDQRDRRLQVSPRAGVPRAGFVYRRGFNAETPGLLALVRGDQFVALSRYDEALREYEAAVAAGNPDLPVARWKLAHGYLQSTRVAEAAALLDPMAEAFADVFEVASGLGFVRYFEGKFDQSVEHLERAATLRTPGPATAECAGRRLRPHRAAPRSARHLRALAGNEPGPAAPPRASRRDRRLSQPGELTLRSSPPLSLAVTVQVQLTIPGRVDWSVVRRVANELRGSSGRLVWGVDGCKSGWFYLAMAKDGRFIHGIARHLEDVVEAARRKDDMVLVDIPIGLSDGPCGRVCDREAREHLKKDSRDRSKSVFPVPARSVIEAGDISHARASDINRRRMRNDHGDPVGLTLQTLFHFAEDSGGGRVDPSF